MTSDLLVIGGGPVGLFACFYGGMRKASVKLLNSMPQLGGQLAALYPEKYISMMWPGSGAFQPSVVDSRMQTSLTGFFAAGDIASYPGKVKLIASGFGEAPTAVNNAITYIDPGAKLSPGHSSHMKLLL